jgi:hypothetical protein
MPDLEEPHPAIQHATALDQPFDGPGKWDHEVAVQLFSTFMFEDQCNPLMDTFE